MARSQGPSAAALATLGALAERVRPVTLAREQRLPVLPALESLLPGGGLRRGSVVSVSAAVSASPPAGPAAAPVSGGPAAAPVSGGATSLALALVAEASAGGSWVAGVGLRSLGLAAAAELGVALERLVLVAAPRCDDWPGVVAALVDGFDLVVIGPVAHRSMRAADARRLVARTRERGSVLVLLGAGDDHGTDVRLRVVASEWQGVGEGHGHLQRRRVRVESGGRGEASRTRTSDLWLPAPGGGVEVVLDPPTPLPTGSSGSTGSAESTICRAQLPVARGRT
jgi:hypothetical protein